MPSLKNGSEIPQPLLDLIMRFVAKRCPGVKSAGVEVVDAHDADRYMVVGSKLGPVTAAIARDYQQFTGVCVGVKGRERPFLVQVFVPQGFGEMYDGVPRRLFYTPMPGGYEFESESRSWDEELVLVLSHELRHVEQYLTGQNIGDEVDAESFAHSVVAEYRPWRNRYFIRTAERVMAGKDAKSNVVPLTLSRKSKNALAGFLLLAACTRFVMPDRPLESQPVQAQVLAPITPDIVPTMMEFVEPSFTPTTVVKNKKPFVKKARKLAPPPKMPVVKPAVERILLSMNMR